MRRLLVAAPLVALVGLFIVTGLRGVDFGLHWDEIFWHIDVARAMVNGGVFLPHSYPYPGLSKWLVLLPAFPPAVGALLATHGDPRQIQQAMQAVVGAPDFLLAARRVFIVLSSLSMVWLYGAALALRRKPWEAFVAAACLGLSWEYAYHARYVANDCILTQFAALMLFLLALFQRTHRVRWLYLAAVAVGLGVGAKSPGVILMVPLFISSVSAGPVRDVRAQLTRLAVVSALAFATFLVTTPGLLLEPLVFLTDAHRLTAAYTNGHGGYTVKGSWPHAKLVVTYLAVDFFSPYRPVAVALFASSFVGAVAWVRRDRRFAAVLLVFPVAFMIFFCRYNVMIARNYIVLSPFLALLAARGLAELAERVRPRGVRLALGVLLATVAVAQATFLVRAGERIRHFDLTTYVTEAMRYVAAHPSQKFRVSEGVRKIAGEHAVALPANVVRAPAGDAVVFLGHTEHSGLGFRKLNDPWLTEAVFGPQEMNFNWYATWVGKDRVVVMTLEKARQSSVPVSLP